MTDDSKPPLERHAGAPLSRRERRARVALRKRDDKRELSHRCAVTASAAAAGITAADQVGTPVLFFHDLHRALGESSCPKCPECTALRREGRIDRARSNAPRAAVLERWRQFLTDMRNAPKEPDAG